MDKTKIKEVTFKDKVVGFVHEDDNGCLVKITDKDFMDYILKKDRVSMSIVAREDVKEPHNKEFYPDELDNIKKEDLTCHTCPLKEVCEFAYDLYNTDGDCLASK